MNRDTLAPPSPHPPQSTRERCSETLTQEGRLSSQRGLGQKFLCIPQYF